MPEEQRAEVWQRVVETTDGKPTAAAIREAVSPPAQSPDSQEERMPTPTLQVEQPTPEEAQRIEEFQREYAAGEPDRDLARRQRVATDLLDRHVSNLALIGESPEVANYLPNLSPNPINQRMLDKAALSLRVRAGTFTAPDAAAASRPAGLSSP